MSGVRHSMVTKLLLLTYATVSAIVSLAFIVACVAHEVIGHGGMCIALGSHIRLLTSVYSHCAEGGTPHAAAGPLMSLATGALFWAILARASSRLSVNWRLFVVFAMAFNLLWGAGYFVLSAVVNTGDWALVLRDLAPEPKWPWRVLMGLLGVYLYYRTLRLVAFYLPPKTPLVFSYLVAGAVACAAALFYTGPTLPALREGALEGFGAAAGLLLIAYLNARRVESPSSVEFVNPSFGWLIASALVTLSFFATLGRGYVFGDHA